MARRLQLTASTLALALPACASQAIVDAGDAADDAGDGSDTSVIDSGPPKPVDSGACYKDAKGTVPNYNCNMGVVPLCNKETQFCFLQDKRLCLPLPCACVADGSATCACVRDYYECGGLFTFQCWDIDGGLVVECL